MNAPYQVLIDPAKLLIVSLTSDDGSLHEFVVTVCRFLVARHPDHPDWPPKVAVEILYDPDVQQPIYSYYAERAGMVRRLADPSRVKRVRPYSQV